MLMAAVPRLHKKWKEVEVEVELKAKESEQTVGCVYYKRCTSPNKEECCAEERPSLMEVEPDHFVACDRCRKK